MRRGCIYLYVKSKYVFLLPFSFLESSNKRDWHTQKGHNRELVFLFPLFELRVWEHLVCNLFDCIFTHPHYHLGSCLPSSSYSLFTAEWTGQMGVKKEVVQDPASGFWCLAPRPRIESRLVGWVLDQCANQCANDTWKTDLKMKASWESNSKGMAFQC